MSEVYSTLKIAFTNIVGKSIANKRTWRFESNFPVRQHWLVSTQSLRLVNGESVLVAEEEEEDTPGWC